MSFNLENFFEFYEGLPHQKEGIALLHQTMPSSLLSDSAAWVRAFRGELPQQPKSPALAGNQGAAGLHHAVLFRDAERRLDQ